MVPQPSSSLNHKSAPSAAQQCSAVLETRPRSPPLTLKAPRPAPSASQTLPRVRLSGILRKSDVALDAGAELAANLDGALLADAEDVLLTMLDFGATLERAAEQSEPSVVTGFAIQLAGSIHAYLREHHVLRAEPALRDARLALVAAARRLLHTSLCLLVVASPDEM